MANSCATFNEYNEVELFDKEVNKNSKLISVALTDRYGDVFSEENLRCMRQLAKDYQFDISFSHIANFALWDHFKELLKIKVGVSRDFYTRLIKENCLSADQLKFSVEDNLFERHLLQGTNGANKKPSRTKRKSWENEISREQNFNKIFKLPVISFFESIFKSIRVESFDTISTCMDANMFALITKIDSLINNFISKQNVWLNFKLNLSFREIGARLDLELRGKTSANKNKKILQESSDFLSKKYGSNYETQNLIEMISIVKKSIDKNIEYRLFFLLSWKSLVRITSFKSVVKQLFYARLMANEGLTADQLETRIRQKAYEYAKSGRQKELDLIFEMNKPNISIQSHSNEKNRFKVKNQVVELGEGLMQSKAVNIYTDEYFKSFLSGIINSA